MKQLKRVIPLVFKVTGIEVQYEGRTLMVIPEKEKLARVKNG